VSFEQTVLLAAIAGFTIFLGLPVGRLRGLSSRTQVMLTAAAAGVILFLLFEVLHGVEEPVEEALLEAAEGSGSVGEFVLVAVLAVASIGAGLLSIVGLTSRLRPAAGAPIDPQRIALGTAIGLGLHNLSEGLAIGASAASGAAQLAALLIVGFALHNATEGFGVAAPLTTGERPSWRFLGLLGLIGGGPTFLGGILGYTFASPIVSMVFLALAAGALIYVFNEMVAVCRRAGEPLWWNTALVIGLVVAFGTEFVLKLAGD
jgi:ZIP family zinc transporter